VKLLVATLLLVAAVVVAKVAIEHLAPERPASASNGDTRAKAAAGTVEAVRFTGPGLRALSLSDLVATREGAPLSADVLASDRERVVAALTARGHLEASADEPIVEWTSTGAARVSFPVEVGRLYVFGTIRVEGKLIAKHPRLAELPTITAGEVVAADRVDASAELLRAYLAQHDLRGTVSVTVEPDPVDAQADVVFTIR
jgi:outer membrane protein assembly factor BamA